MNYALLVQLIDRYKNIVSMIFTHYLTYYNHVSIHIYDTYNTHRNTNLDMYDVSLGISH